VRRAERRRAVDKDDARWQRRRGHRRREAPGLHRFVRAPPRPPRGLLVRVREHARRAVHERKRLPGPPFTAELDRVARAHALRAVKRVQHADARGEAQRGRRRRGRDASEQIAERFVRKSRHCPPAGRLKKKYI